MACFRVCTCTGPCVLGQCKTGEELGFVAVDVWISVCQCECGGKGIRVPGCVVVCASACTVSLRGM